MSLFQSKWAAQILLENKRIFGLDHEASEQEVHEHLRTVESFADVAASLRAEVEKEFTAPTERENALQTENEALENRVKELEPQVASLQANVAQLEKDAKSLKSDLDAKVTEIEALKSEAAAEHTGGETEPGGGNAEPRAYEKNPVYIRAKAMREKQSKKQ